MSRMALNPFEHQDRCLVLPAAWTPTAIMAFLADLHWTYGVHTHVHRYGTWRVVWILLAPDRCAAIRRAYGIPEVPQPPDSPPPTTPSQTAPTHETSVSSGQLALFS